MSTENSSTPTDADRSFEDILERLEAIAETLEKGEPRLEEALALFEEGVRLTREGTGRLDAAERRIEVLLDDGQTQPMEEQPPAES